MVMQILSRNLRVEEVVYRTITCADQILLGESAAFPICNSSQLVLVLGHS